MAPPPVNLRLRWCPPVCLILDLIVFGAQGRSDFMRLGIADVLSLYTPHFLTDSALSFRMLGSYMP